MITTLHLIKDHNKIETLEIMLIVIEVLEKNYAHDDGVTVKDWKILYYWLEKYYCELKSMKNNNSTNSGIGFTGFLTLIFICLKLCNIIKWSWLWVLSPIWISVLIIIVLIIIIKAVFK